MRKSAARVGKRSADPKTWVDSEILTDPFLFRWTVNKAGAHEGGDDEAWYEWAEGPDGKLRLYPRYSPGVRTLRYTPAPGLFREFAQLQPTPEAIRDFAGRRGDLFDCWEIEHTRVVGGKMVGGTSIERWLAKLADVRGLVTMWDQIQDKRRHEELRSVIVFAKGGVSYMRGGTNRTLPSYAINVSNPKDVVRPARCALQWEINRRLSDTETPTNVVPQLAWTPDFRQRIVFKPCNLLSEMFVRFAQELAGEFGLKNCSECPEYFQVGLGGKRAHKTTCSPKCRQMRKRRLDKATRE